MQLVLSVNTSTGRQKFEAYVTALSDLDKPLKQFGAFLRNKARGKFAASGPGWEPTAASTRHKLEHTFTGVTTARGTLRQGAKLRGLQKRLPEEVTAALRQAKISGGGAKLGETIRRYQQSTQRKKDFLRAHGVDASIVNDAQLQKQLKVASAMDRALTTEEGRQKAGLKARKRTRAIVRHKLLGKLASSIRATVKKNRLEVFSVVPWAGLHNDGGTAGKGSRIPARTFLELEDRDLEVLKLLIEDHISGAAGPHGA